MYSNRFICLLGSGGSLRYVSGRFLPALAALGVAMALGGCESEMVAPVHEACEEHPVAPATLVSLEPGDVLIAGPQGGQLCLEFPGVASEYVMAYLDPRWIAAEKSSMPGAFPDSFAVEVGAIQTPVAPPEAGATSALRHPPEPDFHPPIDLGAKLRAHPELAAQAMDPSWPTNRDRPWTLGEVTQLHDPVTGARRPIRVEQLHDNGLVVASIDDTEMPSLERTLAQIDSAREMLADVGFPLLREAFPGVQPLTSSGSGQLLLVIHPELREERGAVGVTFTLHEEEVPRAVMMISPNSPESRRTPVSLSELIVHELSHAFQYRHHHDVEGRLPNVDIWALEGGASLIQKDYVRRLAGIGRFDEHDWRDPSGTTAERRFAVLASPGDGRLTRGYGRTASFLADQVRRRILAGDDPAMALAAVSQGVLHGWQRSPNSLANRQRDHLGEGWQPVDAILTWILSHAADDRTDSPVFQNQTLRNAWDVREGESGWAAERRFVVGQTRAHRSEHEPGSAGFVRVQVSQVGGIVGFTSTAHEVAWYLLRVE